MAVLAPDPESETIAEYQRRKREFQPLWNRNWLTLFLPGFVLFALGGPVGNVPLVAIAGFAICAAAAVRGMMLVLRYCRCPACDTVQWPAVYFPYRQCRGCSIPSGP